MTITTEHLGRVAGACLIGAGVLFVGVQINHPPLTLDFVGSTEFLVRQAAKISMTVLALAGVTGLYLSRARTLGVLGLIGYLVFAAGYLTMFATEVTAGVVLPAIVATSPGYVRDVLAVAVGGTPAGDIGAMGVLLGLSGIGYMLGGLLFGLALFRGRTVVRWAAVLLAVATMGTLALAVLPESLNRFFAIPAGVALVGIGWSAWRTASFTTSRDAAGAVPAAAAGVR